MSRQARKQSGTGIYHVMLRGINRQDDEEKPPPTSPEKGQPLQPPRRGGFRTSIMNSSPASFVGGGDGVCYVVVPILVFNADIRTRNLVFYLEIISKSAIFASNLVRYEDR